MLIHKVPHCSINVGDITIFPSKSARNLGAIFDDKMKMSEHVTAVCQSTNFHLRKISRIRKYLSQRSAEALSHALITSRLDCNNVLLFGLPPISKSGAYRNCKILRPELSLKLQKITIHQLISVNYIGYPSNNA